VLLLGESVSSRHAAAVALGFIGVLLVVRPGFRELHPGHLAAALVPVAGALNVIILRRIGGDEEQTSLIGIPLLGAAAIGGCLSLAAGFELPGNGQLARLLICGILVALGQTGILLALKRSAAVHVGTAHYSQMVWAVVLGGLFFGELPDLWSVAGMSFIAASGVLAHMHAPRAG
jgi:drug/metabolite transporter (DMT)-like permease